MASKMKEKRIEMGLTQKRLGILAGISQKEVSNFELNKRKPTPAVAKAIADALGWSVEKMWTEFYEE